MTYEQTLNYLYTQLPMFQRVGPAAFKKDLTNTLKLCEALDNPQHKFSSIHIAGTNGKGSTAHLIAAVLQARGLKVGLYTSPHYRDFRERITAPRERVSTMALTPSPSHLLGTGQQRRLRRHPRPRKGQRGQRRVRRYATTLSSG